MKKCGTVSTRTLAAVDLERTSLMSSSGILVGLLFASAICLPKAHRLTARSEPIGEQTRYCYYSARLGLANTWQLLGGGGSYSITRVLGMVALSFMLLLLDRYVVTWWSRPGWPCGVIHIPMPSRPVYIWSWKSADCLLIKAGKTR